MKATWIRLLKRAKGGRVKSSDAYVSRIPCIMKVGVHARGCCVCLYVHRSIGWGGGCVSSSNDEAVGVLAELPTFIRPITTVFMFTPLT